MTTRPKERAIFRDICGQEHSELANWLEELKELRDKCCKLEKEANWLATELAKFCSRENCEGCEHSGRQWEEYFYCKILSLGVNSSQTWRNAARKAVEKKNEAHKSAD